MRVPLVAGLAAVVAGAASLVSVGVPLGAAAQAAPPEITGAAPLADGRLRLTWTGEPGPTRFFLFERSVSSAEDGPRNWAGIFDVQVEGAGPHTILDLAPEPGWNCYRVRAKGDNADWSNELCVQSAGRSVPVPENVAFETPGPRPPDFIGVPRILSWEWPASPEGFQAVIEASVPPRFTDVQPPYSEYARIAHHEPPRLSVTTLEWRGPYCFRVRFLAGSKLGEPSAPVCIPRTADAAPYDITRFTAQRRPGESTIELTWEWLFFNTTVQIERSITQDQQVRDWKPLASGIPARAESLGATGNTYVDSPPPLPLQPPTWICYRVKGDRGGAGEFGEDYQWSNDDCVINFGIADFPGNPFPPDLGNSPRSALAPRDYLSVSIALSAALGVFATASWWATRRS